MTAETANTAALTEIDKVQNPALGAWLLWEYGRRYQTTTSSAPSHFLLFFLVLPICLHRPTLDAVNSTQERSGLGKFCEKLGSKREELLAIHERALKLRALTLSSISFGIRAGLFDMNYNTGVMRALEHKAPKPPERVKPHAKGAVKLGAWFEAIDAVNVFTALKVEL
ncbi:three component ABC system middle component [Yoonia sp. I 8.24]|uniref:three component ABC system middle component n=1 Tax=Yoonia sp. I 8.24 TaxID=1537229 RepID=UPI001EDF5382|nr:three component ABC system middle component [Yoonia sp. I 8.24]MCG3268379.1 hypothetical protein [Yoonia sp. I 8.24]